jgi:signal transduction histidine kinase
MDMQTTRRHAPWAAPLAWLRDRVTACARGIVLGMLALAGAVLLQPVLLVLALVPIPGVGSAARWLADLTRRLSGEWCAVPIASPYRPAPAGEGEFGRLTLRQRRRWIMADPATWRDLAWFLLNPWLGAALAGGSVAAIGYGIFGMALPHGSTQLAGVISHPLYGILLAVGGFVAAPWLLRGYGEFARSLLGPTQQAELAQRVRHLAQTRSDTIDAGAAEIRRIERDLHDGAQARLVAMGMTLDAAGLLIDTNPAAAQALLTEARDNSVKALAELRDLVRGVHPPVLADRGLADAVRALALDSPLRVSVTNELPGRPPAPVESAAYFAVSELLANVAKHAEADRVWIDIRFDVGPQGGVASGGEMLRSGGSEIRGISGMLRIGVNDDGRGGADPALGTGLPGIERRLAAFDGVLAVSSPPGGPTLVNMEIPCALSSPKTSSC